MATKSCEILGMERAKGKNGRVHQVLVGTITLKGGKLSHKAEKGHSMEMSNIMGHRDGEDPTKWFNALEETYNGVSLRAEIKKGK